MTQESKVVRMWNYVNRNKTKLLWIIFGLYVFSKMDEDDDGPGLSMGESPPEAVSPTVYNVPQAVSPNVYSVPQNLEYFALGAPKVEPNQTHRDKHKRTEGSSASGHPEHNGKVILMSSSKTKPTPNPAPASKKNDGRPRLKKILFWTKYFRNEDFQFGYGQLPFIDHKCPVTHCTTTTDQSEFDDADVVMFHGPLIRKLPTHRPANQLWVFVQKEPWLDRSAKIYRAYNDMFNLTMTYRTDSDILFPYGKAISLPSNKGKKFHVDPHSRAKPIAWPVSDCDTFSKREEYAQELSKYVDIDVYGECGTLQCSKDTNPACWEMFAQKYRFVLAFENDVCKDYISEKTYRPLQYNIIPIVYGGGNYKAQTPPHSVINIKDFANPRDLARYLKYLSNNSTAYSEYFAWQSEGVTMETYKETMMVGAFCDLCQLLHDDSYKYKTYKDLRAWWTHDICDRHAMEKLKASW